VVQRQRALRGWTPENSGSKLAQEAWA
jgi:hypothetical protein